MQEIKATKDVLMTSLKNVQELEVESRKVPRLEARIDDLEKLLPVERFHLAKLTKEVSQKISGKK